MKLCTMLTTSRFGIVSTALGAGQHLVEQLPGLLVAGDVEEHHDAAQHSVQDGEASVQRRVLNSAANRLIGVVVQLLQRRPLLGPSPS